MDTVLVLNNGVRQPVLGLGTGGLGWSGGRQWRLGLPGGGVGFGGFNNPLLNMLESPAEVHDTLRMAFAAGYRHIDTASYYRNHGAIGHALRESGLPRSELFIVSKPSVREVHSGIVDAARDMLAELGLDHVDQCVQLFEKGRALHVCKS